MKKVFIYALSTCPHCKKAKTYFERQGIAFDFIDVDLLQGEEQSRILVEVTKYNPAQTFPTILIGDSATRGFDPKQVERLLADEK